MHKLGLLVLIMLVTLSSSVSMAKSRKPVQHPPHGAAIAAGPTLAPEAAAMRDAQRFWPNRPLCDDGGYRIRPCDMGEGSRGGN